MNWSGICPVYPIPTFHPAPTPGQRPRMRSGLTNFDSAPVGPRSTPARKCGQDSRTKSLGVRRGHDQVQCHEASGEAKGDADARAVNDDAGERGLQDLSERPRASHTRQVVDQRRPPRRPGENVVSPQVAVQDALMTGCRQRSGGGGARTAGQGPLLNKILNSILHWPLRRV